MQKEQVVFPMLHAMDEANGQIMWDLPRHERQREEHLLRKVGRIRNHIAYQSISPLATNIAAKKFTCCDQLTSQLSRSADRQPPRRPNRILTS